MQLIVARVVQGLAGGIFVPAVTAMIQLLFPGPVRGKAFAIMGSVIGVSTALGPILGGLIIEAFGDENGWRLVFWVNIPIGIVALIAAAKILPAGAEGKAKDGYDLVGLLLLTAGLIALLVPLIEGQDKGWPAWTFVTLAAGVLLIVAFAFWEKRIEDDNPMVPPHLFSHPAFTGGTILALVYFAAFTSIFFTISLLWQAGLGHTALESGVVGVPFAIGSIIGASQSNRLSQRLGRTVLVVGTAMVAVGLVCGVADPAGRSPRRTSSTGTCCCRCWSPGIGSGLFIAPNAQFIVATVNRSEAGAASGVICVMQRVGSAIGIAVIGSVLFGTLHITSKRPGADQQAFVDAAAPRDGGERGARGASASCWCSCCRSRSTRAAGRRRRSDGGSSGPRHLAAMSVRCDGPMATTLDVPRLYSAADQHTPEVGSTVWAVAHPVTDDHRRTLGRRHGRGHGRPARHPRLAARSGVVVRGAVPRARVVPARRRPARVHGLRRAPARGGDTDALPAGDGLTGVA